MTDPLEYIPVSLTPKLTITLEQGDEGCWYGEVNGEYVVVTRDHADAADVLADYLLGKP